VLGDPRQLPFAARRAYTPPGAWAADAALRRKIDNPARLYGS
jgi:hypothetical protein